MTTRFHILVEFQNIRVLVLEKNNVVLLLFLLQVIEMFGNICNDETNNKKRLSSYG